MGRIVGCAAVPILKVLFAAVVFAGLLAVAVDVRPAGACSCAVGTDQQAFDRADAVFTATLTKMEDPDSGRSTAPRVYTFAVDDVLKGEVAPQQTVRSEQSGASCGLEIAGAGPFIVFAVASVHGSSDIELGAGELYAGLCGGTRAISVGGPLDPAVGVSPRPPDATLVVEPPRDDSPASDGVLRLVLYAVFVVAGVIGVRSVFFDRTPSLPVPGSLPPGSDEGASDEPTSDEGGR
jgi:hypothetical protein